MKMFLTRIGFGSKAVITGDATQKDLAPGSKSGLDVALRVLKNVEEIGICKLTSKDVVRHPLVQKIVQAYDDYESRQSSRSARKSARRKIRVRKNILSHSSGYRWLLAHNPPITPKVTSAITRSDMTR